MHNYRFRHVAGCIELEGFPDASKVLALTELEAANLLDLALHNADLQRSAAYIDALESPTCTDPIAKEGLWHAAVVRFMKCYSTGVRSRLDDRIIHVGNGARTAFEYFDALRDKHIAHDVNSFAQVMPAAILNIAGCERKIEQVSCLTLFAQTVEPANVENLRSLIRQALDWIEVQFDEEAENIRLLLEEDPYEKLDARELLTVNAKPFVVARRRTKPQSS